MLARSIRRDLAAFLFPAFSRAADDDLAAPNSVGRGSAPVVGRTVACSFQSGSTPLADVAEASIASVAPERLRAHSHEEALDPLLEHSFFDDPFLR